MRRLRRLAVALPLLTGCYYDDRCGSPGRELELRGVATGAAGDTMATVHVHFDEVLGEVPAATFRIGVMGPVEPGANHGGPLQDFVVSARVEAPDGTTLFTLPVEWGEGAQVFRRVTIPIADRATGWKLRELLRTGRVVLHLETRAPAPGPVRVPLAVFSDVPRFSRANCS